VGINLLREGLDLPEVALVAILDADREGFLRSTTSLIQTCGRASRNVEGRVVLYADTVTGSMERAMDECSRRRRIQIAYNESHGIVPRSVVKGISNSMRVQNVGADTKTHLREVEVELLVEQMHRAAAELRFEDAAQLRDRIMELETELK